MKRLRTLLAVGGILVSGYTTLLIWEYSRVRNGPPAPIHSSLILDYRGPIDPAAVPIRIRVYKIEKWSTASDPQDIFNSKIEIDKGAGYVAFVWPRRDRFYATSATVQDLDGDGMKELLLDSQGTAVRVLSFDSESLKFREQTDELTSVSYDVGPRIVNQGFIFMQGLAFPSQDAANYVPVPRLLKWTREHGFQDVTRELNKYYVDTVLPRMKETLRGQTDPDRQALYQAAIEEVQRELSTQK